MVWRLTKRKDQSIAILILMTIILQLLPFAALASLDGSESTSVAQWQFDEGTGTKVNDSSGNCNNGTIRGATWVSGKVGKALSFDGNDYVEVPYNSILNPTMALTVEAWVNPASNTVWQRVVSKSAYPNTDYSLFRGDKNNIAISVKIGSIARTVYSPENSVPIGAWTYVVGTYDGTSLKLYINGKQAGSIKTSGKINTHAEALRIGGDPAGDYFKGKIDEVNIYNKALTAAEILSRYQAVAQPAAPTVLDAATTTDGKKVLVTFNKKMALLPISPAGFSVKADGVNNSIKAVTLNTNNAIVELTMGNIINNNATNILISYKAGIVKAADGGVLASFYNIPVTNKSKAPLIARWQFNEGTGTKANDASGNCNNGTIRGATWVSGKVGKALSFDGNDYVEVPYNPILNPTMALTVEAWVNPASNTVWQRVVSKSYHPNTDFSIFRGDKNNIAFSLKMGTVARTVYSAANSVPIGTWTYIAGTYDGTRMRLYINGKQVNSFAISGIINAHAEPLRIGGDPKGDYFKGKIDEVSIYNKALSAAEILSRYQAVTQPVPLAVPKNISVTAKIDSISITWEAVANATGYDVEVDGEIRDNGNSTIFEHTGLTDKGMEHNYRIRAKNTQAIGEWSETVKGIITGSVFISDLVCDNQYVHYSDVVNINAIVKNASPNDVLSYRWSVDGGVIKGDKEKISWTAPDNFGVYTITLKVENSKGENDTKSVLINVVPYMDTSNPFDFIEPLEDDDGDGLINSREIELGTSPWNIDTDSDGLNDAKELELGTNPCVKDTDGDGVDDGAELKLGTNPLVKDILPDREFTISLEVNGDNNAVASITGEGNIFYNTFSKSDNPLFFSFKDMIGIPVVLTSPERVDRAVVKIKYSKTELQKKGIVEKDLKLFKFDSINKVFVPVMNSTVDVNSKYVIGEDNFVQEYKTYYIAAGTNFPANKPSVFDVAFALDMTQNLYDVDTDFTCKEGLKNMLDFLPNYSSISVIRSNPFIEVLEPKATDKDVIKYCFEDLLYKPHPGNSDLCSLVDKGIQVLSEGAQKDGKVLFVLSSSYNEADQVLLKAKIQTARDKGIVVYITGFSNNSDDYNDMKSLAEAGAGRLSVATNATVYDISLGEVKNDFDFFIPVVQLRPMQFSSLRSPINTLAADTWNESRDVLGYDLTKHSFDFENFSDGPYGELGGHCAGLAMAAEMGFLGLLPSKVAVSDFDKKMDNKTKEFNFKGEIAYDLYQGSEFLDIQNRDLYKLKDKSAEVKKMLAYWWLRVHAFQKYNASFRVDDAFKLFPNHLETNDVDFIVNQIKVGYPVLICLATVYGEFEQSGHAVLAYGYTKEYKNNIPVKVEFKIYDSNHPMDSSRVISVERVFNGKKYEDKWKYTYDLLSESTLVYSSEGTFLDKSVIYRRFSTFNMKLYKELFDTYYNKSKTAKASIKEESKYNVGFDVKEGVQTTINFTIPKENADKWIIYDLQNGELTEIPREEFSIEATNKGNLIQYIIKKNDVYNQLIIGIETRFVENLVNRGFFDPWIVNIQDCAPDIFIFPSNNFSDLSEYMWCAKEIKIAKLMGVVSGYPDGMFHPKDNVTKAELITMAVVASQSISPLWTADFYLAEEEAKKYSDLKNHWASFYCGFALANEWAKPGNSSNGKFLPDEVISRQEAAYILWNVISSSRAIGIKELIKNDSSSVPFSDMNSIKKEHQSAVSQLYLNNIMQGFSALQFKPNNNLTRAESCKMIINCLKA